MPETLIGVDLSAKAEDQALPLHNRWHPDIPAAASVDLGQTFRIECLDWTDGQIADNDSADDVRDVDLRHVHVLSGPIHVNGVEPGDLLVVDILADRSPPSSPSGDSPGSSPGRTEAASWSSTSPTPPRRSGTSTGSSPAPVTCLV